MSWIQLICIVIASALTQITNGVIPRDTACGTTKTCWPVECPVTGCVGALVSWWNTDMDYLRFEIKVEYAPAGEHYIALGISGDNMMAGSSIVMCRSDANVQLGYTQGRTYQPGTDLYGLQNASMVIANNITTCSFDRIKMPIRNEAQLRSLSNPFFLLRSWGPVTGGSPSYHGRNGRGVSPNSYAYPTPVGAGHVIHPASTTFCACLMAVWLFCLLH